MQKQKIYERRAKRILVKSGFIQDFYYIKKVLESFKTCSRVMLTFQTYLWGRERLSTIRDQILEKHKEGLVACHIRILCDSYIRQVSDIDYEVRHTLYRRYGAIGVWNLPCTQENNVQ